MATTDPGVPVLSMARDEGAPLDPPRQYEGFRREAPITRVSLGQDAPTAWLVTRWEDARAVLANPEVSTDLTRPGYPARTPMTMPPGFFLFQDDPVHDLFRKVLTREFMVKRIEALRAPTARIFDGLMDEMIAQGPVTDFVEAVALPLPSLVISELLGVPYADHAFFQEHSKVLIDTTVTGEQKATAQAALGDYLETLVQQRRKEPRDDLITRLGEQVDAGTFSARDAADVGAFLLFAGHETTANMIGLGVLALLDHPDQLSRLYAGQAELATAIEELLRYLTIAQSGLARVATEDFSVGDTTIRAGDGLIIMLNSANRDETVFSATADDLDLTRSNARQHIAFGYGIHQCLGQPLARMELQVVLPEVFRRMPELRVADGHEVVYKSHAAAYGPAFLPVSW
ncbi:cytochrome [Kribbella sp. ALI-6-A]|uniref:cytochrome P450 n=1 Tax=Kribbella sp. ALI-6-A TaxID=1933817 RepID=UPI00097BEFA1|nr:cytochrome P450 [Kribbella sp. ALI-6-A]ONI78330.1 cytochrome [Kribbella sp. ALI-6-A]